MCDRITRRRMLGRCAILGMGLAARNPVLEACVDGGRVRWVVGWSPGGGFDALSRIVQPFLEQTLDARIVIDNVPGAGGRVGALALAAARPDGRTLGILNGSGFLWQRVPQGGVHLDLLRDFTVLGRLSRRQQVIVTSVTSGLRTLDDLIDLSRRRSIVASVTSPDSASFASLATASELLGLSTEYVSGYPGSRQVVLGLLRGDCDVSSIDIESLLAMPDVERAVPLLQVAAKPSSAPDMSGVPHLGGPTGLVSTRPDLISADPTRARTLAAAIAAYLDVGRLVAGPPGLALGLGACLEQGIHAALTDPDLVAAVRQSGRTTDVATGAEVRRDLPAAMEAVRPLGPVTAAAAASLR